MADEIRLSGSAGYNYSLVRTPVGAAQFRRYAAVDRHRLLRGAQQRMIEYGQDIPAQGAAEVF